MKILKTVKIRHGLITVKIWELLNPVNASRRRAMNLNNRKNQKLVSKIIIIIVVLSMIIPMVASVLGSF